MTKPDSKTITAKPKPPIDRPRDGVRTGRVIHSRTLPAAVFESMVKHLGCKPDSPAVQLAMDYAMDAIQRMDPRDPLEEMLLAQMLLTHMRVMRLNSLANQQTEPGKIRTVNEYADRATNTYRRLMLALAEYRRPPLAAGAPTVGQANIAHQQVVQNFHGPAQPGGGNENATNEQGCIHQPDTCRPTLSADTGGAGIPAGERPAGAALGSVHGSTDASGQGTGKDERPQAR